MANQRLCLESKFRNTKPTDWAGHQCCRVFYLVMLTTTQIASHLREVHFGGNWTASSFKDHLAEISWEQATKQVGSFNTIAALVYHANYFVNADLQVLKGGPLNAHDKYSFDHPPLGSQEDWESLLAKTLSDAENLAGLIEQLPENKLWEDFWDKKHGNYYRNLHGIIDALPLSPGTNRIDKETTLEPIGTQSITHDCVDRTGS